MLLKSAATSGPIPVGKNWFSSSRSSRRALFWVLRSSSGMGRWWRERNRAGDANTPGAMMGDREGCSARAKGQGKASGEMWRLSWALKQGLQWASMKTMHTLLLQWMSQPSTGPHWNTCLMLWTLMPSNCGAGEDSCKSLGQQGDQTSQS